MIDRYQGYSTHKQFHSEIKTDLDLDLERLPSGSSNRNDFILHLDILTQNLLRLIDQVELTSELAHVRHPAKRRRFKMMLQGLMYRAFK